jgi:hypothetical protein
VPSSQTPPEFFIDRSLGRKLLPDALRAAGYTVHTMWSVYGPDAEQRIADVQWVTEGTEKGWVLLSKDDKMRRRSVELTAIEAAGARVFLLTNQQLASADQNAIFLDNIHRIIRLARKPGPYVYGVYRNRVERLWP